MRPRRIPHVYAIIFSLIVLTALASLFVPGGSYERDDDGRVIAGTFRYDDDAAGAPDRPRGLRLLFLVLKAPPLGIQDAANIIAFILVVGGTFKVIERTGSFDAVIRFTVRRLSGKERAIFAATMILFSVGGAVFGMAEEVIPFVLLLVPIVRALGYDPLIAVAVPVIGAGVGFAGAMINPFTVGVAQAIAELPPLSGWGFRSGVWVVVTAIGVGFVLARCGSVRGTPDPGHALDEPQQGQRPTRIHAAVLLILAGGIGTILWGVARYEWYVVEIAAVFLGIGLASGFVARMTGSDIAVAFIGGARDLLSAALIVGIARGIVLLAGETRILDTTLHAMATAIGGLPGPVSANLMFVFQSLLNFFVPSGSGQAALTMPIMAPLADLVGLHRQVAVLAYQFGDGFSNMIIPTGPVLMGSLEIAKVPYGRWFRFAWPLQVWLFGFGVLALVAAVLSGYGG